MWPGSQAIAKSKAYTANAFSLDSLALSTARLYTFTQPGHSLWSLIIVGNLVGFLFAVAVLAISVVSFPLLLARNVVSGSVRDGVCLLFFLGFGVKAGVIPLHIWLPEAHPAAPSSISALMFVPGSITIASLLPRLLSPSTSWSPWPASPFGGYR